MTSKILSQNLLGNLNVGYPVENKNNSTQGFRDNYVTIRSLIQEAALEISNLQGKKIEIVGDATGSSGVLGDTVKNIGSPVDQPDALNLVLSASGVTAGTYTTTHNETSISVDSKGRVVSLQTVPTATRPTVVGELKPVATTNASGNVETLSIPSLTVDTYGTITAVNPANVSLTFGLAGHPLTKGSLLVGKGTTGSAEFKVPTVSYNPAETYVLAWKPDLSADFALAWVKLPAAIPVNPAQVIDITAGTGIIVGNDPAHPTVEFDFAGFAPYADSAAIQTGTQILMYDPATNAPYKIDLSRIFTADPTTGQSPLYALKDDLVPSLGGDLELGTKKIKGSLIQGIQLETINTGKVILRNTQTTASNGLPLDPENYIVSEQRFPQKAPAFSPADATAGITTATLRSDSSGQMYWDKSKAAAGGVTSLTAGLGISFDPTGNITTTGTIQLDYSAAILKTPDVFSDFLVVQDAGHSVYRNVISKMTFTMPNMVVVDPIFGSDVASNNMGQLHNPYKSLNVALQNLPEGSPDILYVLLLPGIYEENFNILLPNVHVISLLGPEVTTIKGGFSIGAGLGSVRLKGIAFDISNIQFSPPDYIMSVVDGVDFLKVDECWFYQDFTEQGRPVDIITLAGTNTGNVHFDRCKFNGRVQNALTIDSTESYVDGRVRFTNTVGDLQNMLYVTGGNGSNTEINGCDYLGQVTHLGGIMDLKNINGIKGDYSDALWATSDDSTDLESQGYIREGIQSTANTNTNNTNFLTLTNVNLRTFIDHTYFLTSSIQKTGTCQWSFANVQRKSDVDTIVGLRYDNHGVPKVDTQDQVVTFTGTTGATNIDSRLASTLSYELAGNTQFTIIGYETAPNAYANVNQAVTFRVSVKQDSTARTVAWAAQNGTIVWDGGSAPASVSLTTGGYGIYEFLRIGSNWFAKRIFAS